MCKFAPNYKNKEGFIISNGKKICLDWDAHCSLCTGEIYEFKLNVKKMIDDMVNK